jgi:uncharacterized damage-inducible protein DinB
MERPLDSTVLHLTRVRLTQDYPAQIDACLEVLDDDQIWWRPNEQSNAVGNLLVHLVGSNRYYLEEVIAGRRISRDRDAEFSSRGGLSKDQIREMWAACVETVRGVLEGLQPSQLEQATDRTGKATTFGQVLLHVTHHNAVHMGQIVWITKMLRPGSLDDIWMKMRGR